MSDLFITNTSVSYRDDLFRALERNGFRICRYEEKDVPVFTLRGKPFLKSPVSLLRGERPKVIIVPEFSGITLQMALLRRRFGYKLVSLCDDSLDMIQGNDFVWTHRLARRLLPGCLDGIILHSRSVGSWYRDRFGIRDLFMPIMPDERMFRAGLERVLPLSGQIRPDGKPVVAFVGRLVGLKNVPTLIQAFEPLQGQARLVIIGDGPEKEELQALAPDALFTGMQTGDDLLAWYNLIDVLVLPSTQEAYGAVTGEALMAGAKVVVSRLAGSSDLVREGENGYIVDPMDKDALTNRIRSLLEPLQPGRPLSLRENLHPFRFADCVADLLEEIKKL